MSLHDTEYSKRLKDIFRGMKRRCYNPNNKAYQYYGAKGITICQEWLDDPTLFYQWSIENGYYDQDSNTCRSDLLSIDRIDPNGNYTPDNCQWVTVAENSGKDKGIYITVNKITQNLTQWACYFSLKSHYFISYYNHNGLQKTVKLIRDFFYGRKSHVDAIHGIYLTVRNERRTLISWARKFKVSERYFITFFQRYGQEDTIKQIENFLDYQGTDIKELFKNDVHRLTINGLTMNYSEWSRYLGKHPRWCSSTVQRHGSEQYLIIKIKSLLWPEQLSEDDQAILKRKYKEHLLTVGKITLNLMEWGRYLKLSNEEYIKSYYKLHSKEETIQRIQQLLDGATIGKQSTVTVNGITHTYDEWSKLTGLKKQTITTYISKYGYDYAVKKINDHL